MKMYRKWSIKLTSSLLQRELINADDIEVYEYSIEVLISDIVYFLIAFLRNVSFPFLAQSSNNDFVK